MTIKTKALPPFQNVVADGTAVLPVIPMGETYHGILLQLGGTALTKAMLTRIKIRLGGKTIWDVTGSQLDTVDQYLGMTAGATFLLIPFAEFNARTIVGSEIGSIDTSIKYAEFSAEVTIAGATAPTLVAHAIRSPFKNVADPAHIPLVRAMIPSTHAPASGGKYNLAFPLGSSAGALLKRIHLYHANITQFDVKMNGIELQGDGTNAVIQFMQNNLTRTTQAGHLCYDPIVYDNQSDVIPTVNGQTGRVNNFEFDVTVSAADNIAALSEMYAIVPNL